MASVANIVRFLPASGSTGDFVYSSGVTGYRTPVSSPALTDGATYRYRAESSDLSEWEIGEGTWTTSTTTLARTTIIHSSTGSKVNFTVAPNVAIVALADQFINPAGDTMTGALVVPNASGLKIKDTDASHTLGLVGGSNLTADRTLTLTTGDASRTLTLTADSSIGGTAYVSGGTDVAVADGGTGASTLAANAVLLGNGTSALQTVAPSTSGNVLTSNGTTWASVAPAITREKLTSARTYYVRTDGSNSNDGLTNSAGGAFLTIAKAMTVAAALDLGGNAVTVQVGAGTYAEAVTLAPLIGGTGTLIGDTTTPSNVVISATSAHAVQATNGNRAWTVRGFKLTTTTAGYGLHINNGSAITYNNLDFGAASGGQITVLNVSSAICTGNYSISGGAPCHWFSDSNSTILSDADTITLSGTPDFSTAFAFAHGGAMLKLDGNTFSGSATGKRYQVQNGAVIFVNGAGTSYLPGNTAGTGTNFGASPYGLYT